MPYSSNKNVWHYCFAHLMCGILIHQGNPTFTQSHNSIRPIKNDWNSGFSNPIKNTKSKHGPSNQNRTAQIHTWLYDLPESKSVLLNVDDRQWWKTKIQHKSYDAGILHELAMAVSKNPPVQSTMADIWQHWSN